MKNLVLMTSAAVILSAPAMAAITAKTQHPAGTPAAHSYTQVDHGNDGTVYVKTTTYKEQVDADGNIDFSGNYKLADSDKSLLVKGTSAYLVSANGSSFYAPQSSYVTSKGQTFVVEKGQVIRMENSPAGVTVNTQKMLD